MALFLPRDWRSQPPYPQQINWDHPLALGLRFFIVGQQGGSSIDLVTRSLGARNGSADIGFINYRRAHKLAAASSDFYSWADNKRHDIIGDITLAWRGTVASGSAYRHFIGKHAGTGSTANPYDYRTDNSANPVPVLVRANASGAAIYLASVVSITPSATAVRTVEVTHVTAFSVVPTFYLDGIGSGATNGGSTVGSADPSSTGIRVGRRSDGSVQADGYTEYVVGWARVLTAQELAEFRRAPYALLKRAIASRVIYSFVSGGANSAAGSSTLTFAASGTTSATKQASGSSSLTFAASAVGSSATLAAGTSSLTFSATGVTAATKQAAGSSSLTFGVTAVSTATAETTSADAGGGHSPQRRKRRYILPDDTEVYATDIEIRDILREFVKPKPQKTKKKAARVIPLEARVEFVEEPTKKAERIVVKQQIAVWQPDDTLYQQMVARLVVQQRRRKTVEFLLLAA